jgi:8-oxo-dGTP diphosphatase
MTADDFGGCKLALIHGESLLIYKRDEMSSIPFPGMLDFPGGGGEGNETPKECALRELQEEFGLHVDPSRLEYCEQYTTQPYERIGFFFATEISEHEISNISFGNEGIFWQMIPIQEYFTHPKAVPHLKERLRVYLGSNNGS